VKIFFRKTIGCISGIVSFGIGILSGLNALTLSGIESAFQQTVQYLSYVGTGIFLVGGLIIYQLDHLMATITESKDSELMSK
jgi:high-affinity nickel permease